MTVIALVRHGQTDWNFQNRIQGVSDVPLNDTGRQQAAEAATLLAGERWALPWTAVVTSPLVRAGETGAVIASKLGIPVLDPLPGLAERDYGAAEGMHIDEAHRLYPDRDYPRAEPTVDVTARSLESLGILRAQHPGEHLIVVAHGGLLHGLLSHLHGSRVPTILNSAANLVAFDDTAQDWLVYAINNEMLPGRDRFDGRGSADIR